MKPMNIINKALDGKTNLAPVRLQHECPSHGITEHWQIATLAPVCLQCEANEKAKASKDIMNGMRNKFNSDMKKLGINPESKDFSDWKYGEQKDRQLNIIKHLQKMVENFNLTGRNNTANILLIGGTGSGKTMLVTAMAKALCNKAINIKSSNIEKYKYLNVPCQLIRSSDITHGAKATWSQYGKSEQEFINNIANTKLLIIDDLGDNDTASNIEMAIDDRNRIGQIIDKRYHNQPTIITTNMTAEQVANFLGDRAWDRLQENLIVIKCDWTSYRQLTAKVAYL